MKLIKALAAAAFSVALFAPSSFAATKTEAETTLTFSHDTNYTCSIATGTQNDFALLTQGQNSGSIKASVENIVITNNGDTDVSFTASGVSAPTGSVFSMEAGGTSGGDGSPIALADVSNGANYELEVLFSNGATPGAYAATVVVTCTYSGDETLTDF